MTDNSGRVLATMKGDLENVCQVAVSAAYQDGMPIDELCWLWATAHAAEIAQAQLLEAMRASRKAGWRNGEIGEVLGVTRQAVQKRLDGRGTTRTQPALQTEQLPLE